MSVPNFNGTLVFMIFFLQSFYLKYYIYNTIKAQHTVYLYSIKFIQLKKNKNNYFYWERQSLHLKKMEVSTNSTNDY